MSTVLRAPFPYFGGKRRAAELIWSALGNVDHYVEPFAGSAAVLLARPHVGRCETINDLDGMVANFWRAAKSCPDAVIEACDWPVIEADLHARHLWLIGQRESLMTRLIADPEWCDPKLAGWWVWGACLWIGSGWCGEKEPSRQLPFIGNAGIGVHSQRGHSIRRISARLRKTRVTSGDFSRVLSKTTLYPTSPLPDSYRTGILFDPPYAAGSQQYAAGGTGSDLAVKVRLWCVEHGDDPMLRICLCGYDDDHSELERLGWTVTSWNSAGSGYVGEGKDRTTLNRERLWFSPHCLRNESLPLFGGGAR